MSALQSSANSRGLTAVLLQPCGQGVGVSDYKQVEEGSAECFRTRRIGIGEIPKRVTRNQDVDAFFDYSQL